MLVSCSSRLTYFQWSTITQCCETKDSVRCEVGRNGGRCEQGFLHGPHYFAAGAGKLSAGIAALLDHHTRLSTFRAAWPPSPANRRRPACLQRSSLCHRTERMFRPSSPRNASRLTSIQAIHQEPPRQTAQRRPQAQSLHAFCHLWRDSRCCRAQDCQDARPGARSVPRH